MRPTVSLASVVLAAGASTRFGSKNKLHANVEGIHLVERVVRTVASFEFSRNLLVVAPGDRLTMQIGKENNFNVVVNPDSRHGLGTSLSTAVSELDAGPEVDGCAIFLGDMPFLKYESISAVIRRFKETGTTRIVRPTFMGVAGHPVIFPASFQSNLRGLKGEEGAAQLIRENIDDVEFLDVDDDGVVRDIDVTSDLE
ncbi:MAG: nucleotidyltransferase family protein [Planctomycetota bacterium]